MRSQTKRFCAFAMTSISVCAAFHCLKSTFVFGFVRAASRPSGVERSIFAFFAFFARAERAHAAWRTRVDCDDLLYEIVPSQFANAVGSYFSFARHASTSGSAFHSASITES